MQNLWAPWRMEYIRRIDESGECFLCAALKKENCDRESLVLQRGEFSFCILNRFPYSNGHILVAPNRHLAMPGELTDRESLDVQHLISRAIAALQKGMAPHGFNIGLNLGRTAGAGVPGHLHWHVVPRWNGDTNFMPVLGDVKVIPQALNRTWELLNGLLDAS